MKLRQFKILNNDIYTVTLRTEDWSEADKVLMTKFGEPEIDLGGSFTVPTFTLDANLVRILSESPFVESFDSRDDAVAGDALAKANRWATDITTRITSAMGVLRAEADTFSGESVTTI